MRNDEVMKFTAERLEQLRAEAARARATRSPGRTKRTLRWRKVLVSILVPTLEARA